MKKLLRPKVLIPVVLSVAIIAALLGFGDIHKVVGLMVSFPRLYLLWYLLLMAGYEAVRCAQWHYLLKALDIHAPIRTQVFTFLAGEVAKSVPIGNYFQNYLLQRSKGADFGRTSAATTFIVLIEVAVSLLGIVIIGVGTWSGWLRPVILVGLAVAALAAWGIHRLHGAGRAPRWMTEHKMWRKVLDELKQFREGAIDLLDPRTLGLATLLGAIYLIIAGSALYIIVSGLNIHISLWDALAVYFFSLAFSLIFPLPIDIGVLEVSGVGAFLAEGVTKPAAVSAMLLNRVLSIGSALVIALIGMIFMRDEFRAAMADRPKKRARGPRGRSEGNTPGGPSESTQETSRAPA